VQVELSGDRGDRDGLVGGLVGEVLEGAQRSAPLGGQALRGAAVTLGGERAEPSWIFHKYHRIKRTGARQRDRAMSTPRSVP
jgi:hypothetical protein